MTNDKLFGGKLGEFLAEECGPGVDLSAFRFVMEPAKSERAVLFVALSQTELRGEVFSKLRDTECGQFLLGRWRRGRLFLRR